MKLPASTVSENCNRTFPEGMNIGLLWAVTEETEWRNMLAQRSKIVQMVPSTYKLLMKI